MLASVTEQRGAAAAALHLKSAPPPAAATPGAVSSPAARSATAIAEASASTGDFPDVVMRAAVAPRFGPNSVLEVRDDVPREPDPKPGSGDVLISVGAVSLSPGDIRMLSGDTRLVKKPASWPYVPAGDVCGVVAAVDPQDASGLQVGDPVIGTWEIFGVGGIAEYCRVPSRLVERKPPKLSDVEGAAVANSAVNAMLAVRDAGVKPGDRVLVIGGAGGIGSSIVQLARAAGAEFVAATTSQARPLLESLGVDLVIDYGVEDWAAAAEAAVKSAGGRRFDVVFDCALGSAGWSAVLSRRLLKRGADGGVCIGVVQLDWHIDFVTVWQGFSWALPVLWRYLWTWFWPCRLFVPRWVMLMGAPRGKSLKELLGKLEDGQVAPVIDPRGPFAFTTRGVVAAFDLLESRHAHGKVVIDLHKRWE